MTWYRCTGGNGGGETPTEITRLTDFVSGADVRITESGHDSNYASWHAFDGVATTPAQNPAQTCWSATRDTANQYIQYDLVNSFPLEALVIRCFCNYSADWVGNVQVLGSNDETNWTNILRTGATYPVTAKLLQTTVISIPLSKSTPFRYVRFASYDTNFTQWYAPSIFVDEISIYGYANVQQIPYISSSCAQQLNLPVYMDEDIVIKTKIMIPNASPNDTSIINNEWNTNCLAFYIASGRLVLRDTPNSTPTFDNKPWKWVDIEFKTSDGSLVYDGVKYGGNGGNYNHKVISLFGIENGHFSAVAFQSIKVYKDGDLYMYLEPRKDEQTGGGYFYDTIGLQSYSSSTNTPLVYNDCTLIHTSISYQVTTISGGGTDASIRVKQFTNGVQTDTSDITYQSAGSHIRFHDLDVYYSSGKWKLTSWNDYIKYNGNEYGVGDLISEWTYNSTVAYMLLLVD